MFKFIKSLYFSNRLYYILSALVTLFTVGYFFPIAYAFGKVLLLGLIVIIFVDILMLYNSSKLKLKAERETPQKMSNGDENEIVISLKNNYAFAISIEIIDEIPFQFQKRDFLINNKLKAKSSKKITYILRPVERGEYSFGKLNIYVSAIIGIVKRRFIFDEGLMTKVYPSYIQMRKYELMAISNRLTEAGIKKIRKITTNNEFEQIREYIPGDDIRTLNWKATARRTKLMVNQYQDEKSQRVYSIIDMGRTMKSPFDEMTLLDYAINSSLVISNIAMHKHDKAGIITFSNTIKSLVPADRKASQMTLINEVLYKQETNFKESDYEMLYATIKRKVKQRSLLLLYTNFEALISLERQMKYLKMLAKTHVVVVIFFKNTEINELLNSRPRNTEEIYIKTIAEKFSYEKRQIVKELKQNGIYSILTKPENLTVNTINKYLEFKAKGLI